MASIRINAKQYEDHDDCLQAASHAVAAKLGLEGWDLTPRWENNQRDYILLDVPSWASEEETTKLTDNDREAIKLDEERERERAARDGVLSANHVSVEIRLRDPLNPGFGYAIKVIRERDGAVLLFTSKHPITGRDLDFVGCLEVAAMYGPGRQASR